MANDGELERIADSLETIAERQDQLATHLEALVVMEADRRGYELNDVKGYWDIEIPIDRQ